MGINKRRTKNKILFSQYFSVFWGKNPIFSLSEHVVDLHNYCKRIYFNSECFENVENC